MLLTATTLLLAAPALLLYVPLAAKASASAPGPQVQLDQGLFTGTRNGSINRFLGIPFAKPP